MKMYKVVVAYHPRVSHQKRDEGQHYLVTKIQGNKPAIKTSTLTVRVGAWLREEEVENLGRLADLTVIIGK